LRPRANDRIEDLVCDLVLDEGFWVVVVVLDKAPDGLFEFSDEALEVAAQLFFPSAPRTIVPAAPW
jgi:hypothetical protein